MNIYATVSKCVPFVSALLPSASKLLPMTATGKESTLWSATPVSLKQNRTKLIILKPRPRFGDKAAYCTRALAQSQ